MRRIRFSIASLLLVVLFLAVAFGALREATDLWDGALFGLATVTLLVSVLLAVHCSDRKGAFWLGFALFGWVYLLASLVPQVEQRLMTTKGLAYLASKRPWMTPAGMAYFDYDGDGDLDLYVANPNTNALYLDSGTGTFQDITPSLATIASSSQPSGNVRLWSSPFMTWKSLTGPTGTSENFLRIGHSLTALVLALLGGHLSRSLHARGRGRHSAVSGDPHCLAPGLDSHEPAAPATQPCG
jgi:hypothetical protein